MSNTKSNQSKEILNLAQEALNKLEEIKTEIRSDFSLRDLKLKRLGDLKESLANLEEIKSIDFKNLNNDDKKNYNAILNVLENYSFGISKENNFERVKLSTYFRDDGSGIYEIENLNQIQGNIDELIKGKNKEISKMIDNFETEIKSEIGDFKEKLVRYFGVEADKILEVKFDVKRNEAYLTRNDLNSYKINNLKQIQGKNNELIKDGNKEISRIIDNFETKIKSEIGDFKENLERSFGLEADKILEVKFDVEKANESYLKILQIKVENEAYLTRNKGVSANLNLQNVNLEVDQNKQKTNDATSPCKN